MPDFVNLIRLYIRTKIIILDDHLIRYLHDLLKNHCGGLADADVIAKALAHLLCAVNPLEERHEQRQLGLLAVIPLNVPSHQNIEGLIRASQLYVRPDSDGIVGLHQGIKEFMHGKG